MKISKVCLLAGLALMTGIAVSGMTAGPMKLLLLIRPEMPLRSI